jgi:chemotaxis protein methyltransferase CheR
MKNHDLEDIELALLLEAIYQRYGHDFRHYAKASIKRRVRKIMGLAAVQNISQLIPRLMHDEAFFSEALGEFSVPVSEMFRDPAFFKAMRTSVIPYLKTYPYVKIWIAGCASGEEVFSTAVILEEEGFYDRATIFATDFNSEVLKRASEGLYPLDKMRDFTANYQAAGGRRSFSDYYHANYDSAILDKSLTRNITFAGHNLVTDGVFSEMHLILCRNVMIYFDKILQDRVLKLFLDSLIPGGVLALGSKETLHFAAVMDKFQVMDQTWKIYRKNILG